MESSSEIPLKDLRDGYCRWAMGWMTSMTTEVVTSGESRTGLVILATQRQNRNNPSFDSMQFNPTSCLDRKNFLGSTH